MRTERRAWWTAALRGASLAVVLIAAGCTGAGGGGTPTTSPTATASAGAARTLAPDEPAPSPRTEDPDHVEAGAQGGDAIAVEIAGLPVGGGAATDEDGTWCQVLAWDAATAAGATVEVHTVRIGTPGARLRDTGCQGAPPCVGAVLVDGAGQCAVVVTPPSPDVDLVRVALDATVRCTVRAACDAVRGDGAWHAVTRPVLVDDLRAPDAPAGTPTDATDVEPTGVPPGTTDVTAPAIP